MRVSIDPMVYRLLRDVSAGIRVLQNRDGVPLSEDQILERASNIVMGLVGNYRIQELDPGERRSTLDTDSDEIALDQMAAE
jgi:hypothetical protein